MTLHRSSFTRAVVLAATLISGQALAQASAAPAAAAASAAAATGDVQRGKISWYGQKSAGRRTASGEAFDPDALTMAHKTLPFGTWVEVTNPANKRSVALRVNDRGPIQADRLGDVSLAAARRLDMTRSGVIDAEIAVVSTPTKR